MKSQEIGGHWWLADRTDHRVAGTLTFDGDKFPELDLFEALTEDREAAEKAIVLGLSGDAQPVTVQVDFETDRPRRWSQHGGEIVRQRLGAKFVYMGAYLAGPADREFSRITVSYTDLLEWTGWQGPTDTSEDAEHAIRFKEPDEIRIEVPWGTVQLRFTMAIGGDGPSKRCLSIGAGLLCVRTSPVPFDVWLDEVVGPLRDFVSLVTDRANQVEEVTFERAEREPFGQLIYVPTTVELPQRTGYSFEFPCTALSLDDRLPVALCRWFELQSVVGPALDLYFSTVYRPSMHLENRFLNVVAAAEAYHRRMVPPDAEHVERHRARLDRILSVADKQDQGWLKWRLRYGYEPSFADRLTELATRASSVLELWIGEASAFAGRVADVRNLLVHQDPGSETARPTGRDLIDLLEDVGLVFLVCLYEDLGFTHAEIREMLRHTRRWQFLELRKRGWKD
jgi:hypothetical protein